MRRLAGFLPDKLESHKIYYGILKAGERPLDEVLLSYFAEGRSFTGEETFEISCHGSEAIVSDVLQELVSAGARPARRGEFTFRAFMNGRLDLVQAESVLAMIESRSARASQLALRQLQGEFSGRLRKITDDLTWVLAQLEANIDYAAEDIVIAKDDALAKRLEKIQVDVERLLSTYNKGRIVREGFQVALVGRPNAGKSSLLNALSGEERAIVTEVAGTTRDFVESELSLDGYRVTLVDTAGLRVTDDRVEKIGVQRTLEKMIAVDLVLYVADSAEGLSAEDEAFFDRIPWEKTRVLWNKVDLPEARPIRASFDHPPIAVSAVNGIGFDEIRGLLREKIAGELAEDSTLVSNARHFEGLQTVRNAVARSLPLVLEGESPDLIALELQSGLVALYEILGLTYDDQVMDRVFKEFCLGK
jgi:tRNA modification GTPase